LAITSSSIPNRRASIGPNINTSTTSTPTAPLITLDDAVVEGIIRDFAANWRTGIQQINDDVLTYFANFRNGFEILKQVLTQVLLYYTRFQDLVKRCYSRPPTFVRDIVSTATILMEIKRYSRTF
jgi:vacuolar protein sorting-associated protein 52